MNKTEQHKKAMLEALEKSLGIVTSACRSAGIGRTTFYQWIKDDAEFAKDVKEIENVTLDFVESKLHKQIADGIPTSTIFYLKTKGKNRGYIERQEIDHTTKGESIKVDLSKYSVEELSKMLDDNDSN